jgi:hypothetical protein
MKRFTILMISTLLVLACRDSGHTGHFQAEFTGKDALDEWILETIREEQKPFDWNRVDDEIFWQAMRLTDRTLVVGYSDGVHASGTARDEILEAIVAMEGGAAAAGLQDILVYDDPVLGFMMVRIDRLETLRAIRQMPSVTFTEVNEYVIDLETIGAFTGVSSSSPLPAVQPAVQRRDMILDPFQEDPDYVQQVYDYKPGLWEVLVRHNLDEVYRNYGIFGEDVGVAVIDNGIVDWALELFLANGYGGRETLGFYNPTWFLPWTQPDGISPQPYDVMGISLAIENQWLHGSGMIESAFVVTPNADITCVRASTAIVILTHDQILGISNAIRAMADRPDIRVTNMSMGTIFMLHRVKNAINYYHSKGKIMACAAGTTFEEIKHLLGIIFPAYLGNTISVTGIANREETGGEFIAGSTAHTGPQNDFCVENSAASSEATARMVGMLGLIWSADPSLTREEVLDIAIQASHFYQLDGQKDPEFGWGTVDMLQAVEMALE